MAGGPEPEAEVEAALAAETIEEDLRFTVLEGAANVPFGRGTAAAEAGRDVEGLLHLRLAESEGED